MSSFTRLTLTPLSDGRHWRTDKSFAYYLEGSDENIVVPAGFVTDFASVPRFFWRILPPWGRYGPAAIVHDWLYHTQQYSRKRCDEIFLEAMRVLEVGWLTRRCMYRAVRLFGRKAWKN